jgi:hypothetical protein
MPLVALFGLGFPSAPPYGLTLRHSVTRRPIMQKVRRRAFPCGHSSSTACRRTVSGTISLPSPGCFSPFPHGTSSLSVADDYLALEDGPPGFPQGFSCPAVLGNSFRERSISLTGLSPPMVVLSRNLQLSISLLTLRLAPQLPHNPFSFAKEGLGSSPFARHY